MGRTTKQLSGGGKDKFLKALIAAQDDLVREPADRLTARLIDAITDIRVKRDVWDDVGREQKQTKGLKGATGRSTLRTHDAAASARPAKAEQTSGPTAQVASAPATSTPAAAATFDPFAFSALAVLTRNGRAALEAKVAEITAAEHLIALAAAQHLGVDRGLTDVSALRDAIIAATEARLRERRAAAS